MKSIFLCFANDEKESLQSLKEEREELLRLLDNGNSENHFTLKEIPNATIEKVINGLIDYSKSLNVFFFSGHAGRDKLAFEDSNANVEGIAGLLEQCSNLDLVILNGCSTVGQVKHLGTLRSRPAIISTSAPVEDFSATKFSITLFKALVEQETTLKQAFDIAVSAVQTRRKTIVVGNFRELVSRDEEDGVWGIFIPEDRRELQNWQLKDKKSDHKNPSLIPGISIGKIKSNQTNIANKMRLKNNFTSLSKKGIKKEKSKKTIETIIDFNELREKLFNSYFPSVQVENFAQSLNDVQNEYKMDSQNGYSELHSWINRLFKTIKQLVINKLPVTPGRYLLAIEEYLEEQQIEQIFFRNQLLKFSLLANESIEDQTILNIVNDLVELLKSWSSFHLNNDK